MSSYNFHHTSFLTSAPDIHHITDINGVEVAFAGRSNAGKSTALNALTNQKSLARTSKTPGRTQLINLFEVSEGKRLVDLPGYGYAKVPEATKRKWQRSLGEYLQKRQPLKGLVLLMDIRHPLKELDQNMLQWAIDVNLPTLILLTKADKLAHSAQTKQLELVRGIVKNQLEGAANQEIYVEKFSALKKIGIDKLTQQITAWFDSP